MRVAFLFGLQSLVVLLANAAASEKGTGIDLDGRTDAAGSTQNPGTHTGAGGRRYRRSFYLV
jgi:hypothetical protein